MEKTISKEEFRKKYLQYKKNLEEEICMQEAASDVKSEDEWIAYLKNRRSIMRGIYQENEELLASSIYPIISGEMPINQELADEILELVSVYCKDGYNDMVAGIDLLKRVEEFYGEDAPLHIRVQIYYVMGTLYSNYTGTEYQEKSIAYFKKIRDMIDQYFQIDNQETRRRILVGSYNYELMLVNSKQYKSDVDEAFQRKILKEMEEILELYNNPKVRALDGDICDIEELAQSLIYDICGNLVCYIHKEYMLPEFLERANMLLTELYEQARKECSSVYEIEDEIYLNYLKIKMYCEELDKNSYIEKYIDYCKYVLEHKTLEEYEGHYVNGTCYQVAILHLPNFVSVAQDEEIDIVLEEKVKSFVTNTFLTIVEKLPRFRNVSLITGMVTEASKILILYLPRAVSPYFFLQKVIINRDDTTMLHAQMVRQLSNLILNAILEEKPELLVGTLGLETVADVLKQQEVLEDYMRKASLLFDIGKIQYSEMIMKEGRNLTKQEIARVRGHTEKGYEIVSHIPVLKAYYDVIRGHHRSYDGKGGYPASFSMAKSPVKFFADIIRICDSMEAATTEVGKNYRQPKSYDAFLRELNELAGIEYNPDIVELINNNAELDNELRRCCSVGRERVYYEAYHSYIEREEEKRNLRKEKQSEIEKLKDSNESNGNGQLEQNYMMRTFSKSTFCVFSVDLRNDYIQTIHNGKDSLVGTIPDGRMSTFLNSNNMGARIHKDDKEKIKYLMDYSALTDHLEAGSGIYEFELRFFNSFTWKWGRVQLVTLEEEHGIPTKILVTIQDIDKQCRKREMMRNALEQAREEAKSANIAKSMFLSSISHEIRTPMNAIVGMTEILMREELTQEQRGYLVNIRDSGKALLSMINDILDISKIESGKLEISEDFYDLYSMLQDIGIMLQTRAQDRGIELRIKVDKNVPRNLIGDEVRIRQIFINIINNAIKFTDEGYVEVCVYLKETTPMAYELYAEVEDTGMGMREEDLAVIFDTFQQVDAKRNRGKEGSGLGLSICKSLLEMMGGCIHVRSEYGVGSVFSFSFMQRSVKPLEAEIFAVSEKNLEQIPLNVMDTVKNKNVKSFQIDFIAENAKILIVDDSPMNLSVAEGLLKPIHMKIDTAESGIIAIQKIKANAYDLVFLDQRMPVMDGEETVREIRKMHEYDHMPVIALSADVMPDVKERLLKAGMNDFVAKPIDMEEICYAIRKWLPSSLIQDYDNQIVFDPNELAKDICKMGGIHIVKAIEGLGSKELFEQMLHDFYQIVDKKIELVTQLWKAEDIENYTIEVHALKTSARMIGALELSDLFYQLEMHGKNGEIEEINKKTQQALDLMAEIKEQIAPAVIRQVSCMPIEQDVLARRLQKMKVACMEFELEHLDQMTEELKRYDLSVIGDEVWVQIQDSVADMDLDRVVELIDSLEFVSKI